MDHVFLSYIEKKKYEYDEGDNITWVNMTEKDPNKHEAMVQEEV